MDPEVTLHQSAIYHCTVFLFFSIRFQNFVHSEVRYQDANLLVFLKKSVICYLVVVVCMAPQFGVYLK